MILEARSLPGLHVSRWVPGQFGAGQFGADNSAQDNSARTIRRDNLSRTIRRKVYIINFIENSASTQQYSFHQSRFHFSNFFINLASISAILFYVFLTLTYIVYIEVGLLT